MTIELIFLLRMIYLKKRIKYPLLSHHCFLCRFQGQEHDAEFRASSVAEKHLMSLKMVVFLTELYAFLNLHDLLGDIY